MSRRHHCAFGEIPAETLKQFKELVKWHEKPHRIAQKLNLSVTKVYWIMSALEEEAASKRAREMDCDSIFPRIERHYGKRLEIKDGVYILDKRPIRALELLKRYNSENKGKPLGKVPVDK